MLPRSFLVLSVAFGLPLMTGACGIPLAVTAASYGADAGLAAATDKTSTDHFLSMVSKEDCSVWRVFRHQLVCKDRPEGAKDPYNVNYDEPFREQSEGGGVSYGAPLHAQAGAPATSWDAAAYKPAPAPEAPAAATAVAETATPVPEAAPPPVAAPAAPAHGKKKVVTRVRAKKPSPSQVASAR